MSNQNLENLLENSQDKKENLNDKLENLKNQIDSLKEDENLEMDNLFSIVVKELEIEKNLFLPNKDIYSISYFSPTGKEDIVFVVRFKQDKKEICTLFFKEKDDNVSTRIKNEFYNMSKEEAKIYKEKYFDYIKEFIQMKKNILENQSSLAKNRLEKLGI